MDWEDFAIQCEDLDADLDALPDAAQDFSDSVSRRLAGMREWAEEHEHVTERMWTALENMQEGVSKWLDRE